MDYVKIKQAAEEYKPAMVQFLREIIAAPGESAGEQAHAERILQEMQALGFDDSFIDPQGNVIG